jgi:hypothetical protein
VAEKSIRENGLMREFTSINDYRDFANSVTARSRYVFEQHVEEFLKTVTETSASLIETLEINSILHRAQLGYDVVEGPVDPDDPTGEKVDESWAYTAKRMKPPRDSAREGRVNPKGIPCLYLADDEKTAMAEMRPWIGEYISLARFKTVKPLKILYLPEPDDYFFRRVAALFGNTPDAMECGRAVWGQIAYAFSEPVSHSDDKADYAPTQILAETFRALGCDGIRYKSRLDKGFSFALFDLDAADMISCVVHETLSAKFEFSEGGNPYYHKMVR